MMLFCLPLLAAFLLPASAADQKPPLRTKFKAAVYEHAVILPADPKKVVSRAEALILMGQNLAVYDPQAAEAKRQGADILVFPEDGLYGFRFTWESITPYLEYVPDPVVSNWVPCDEPDRFPDTEVQQALSCMAKQHGLYIVANMGDRQPCHKLVDAKCRTDHQTGHGHFQYNTNVVFDPAGKLIAKYHKKNLFFEYQFDTPTQNVVVYFDTPFGRWTTFTCFDILFHDPAVSFIEKEGIANVAFPTAWMDALPLLSSVEFHSAFARGMGVNFLAANIHKPEWRAQGSGIYNPDGMQAFVHNATISSQPTLLVTELDVLHHPKPPALSTLHDSLPALQGLHDSLPALQGHDDRPSLHERPSTPQDAVLVSERMVGDSEVVGPETAFVAELFHDLFNFVQLERDEGVLRTCNNGICCHLNYSISHWGQGSQTGQGSERELFAFGAFDGMHTVEGTYYLQICALVRCANQSRNSCGQPTNQSATSFQYMSLRGENFTEASHVYPEVLLTTETQHLRLAASGEWRYGELRLTSDHGFSYPVLAAALFGRAYERDPPAQTPPRFVVKALTPQSSTAMTTVTSLWTLTAATITALFLKLNH